MGHPQPPDLKRTHKIDWGRVSGASLPEQGLPRRRSMADGKKVAGVVRAGSPGHDFPKRKHWEREGDKASPYWGKT